MLPGTNRALAVPGLRLRRVYAGTVKPISGLEQIW